MNWKYRFGALILSFFVLSCGDDSDQNSTPPANYAEFRQEADQALAQAACAAVFRCPDAQSSVVLIQAGRYADEQTCERELVSDAGAGQVRPRE